jgi:hypothetical protein
MKKSLQLLLIAFILTLITVVNIRGMIQNYYGFYYPDKDDKLNDNGLYRSLSFIEDNRTLNLFLSYTGFETGYGFFAPNVASDFITAFTVYNPQGQVIDTSNFIRVRNKESFIRISSAYTLFLEYVKEDTLSIEYQKCNIFLQGLALKILQHVRNADKVRADLYLFHYPLLQQLEKEKRRKPDYILYASKVYTLHDYANWK